MFEPDFLENPGKTRQTRFLRFCFCTRRTKKAWLNQANQPFQVGFRTRLAIKAWLNQTNLTFQVIIFVPKPALPGFCGTIQPGSP